VARNDFWGRFAFLVFLSLRPFKIAPIVMVGRLRWLPFRFKCGDARHFGNAFQYGTVREEMEGILEMPYING